LKKYIYILFPVIFTSWQVSGQPLTPLQGGENVASATVLSGSLPVSVTGTTEGYNSDYDELCPYSGGDAPDVVYAYTPASNKFVDIDLCGSTFDTKLYIYENTVTPGVPYDCNDDYYQDDVCGYYVSKIENLYLAGGNTYYIVIDGYFDNEFGEYTLGLSESAPPPACTWGVDIICPAGAVSENETCGNNANGGCTMTPGTEQRETVPVTGGSFCGTLWANGGIRDYDQYELVLTEASLVILSADATQEIQFGLMTGGTGGYGGNPSCATITGVAPSASAGPCNESVLDLAILDPGTYWFSVSMTASNGFPCSNHYWIDFEVIPQPCPTPVDLVALNITATSAQLSWTETGSANAWEYQVGPAGFTPASSGTQTVVNPKLVTGLTANTAYDFYVRSSCDPAFSTWEGPQSFTTSCGTISSVPFSEGFESTWPPSCWTDSESADYGWSPSTYGSAHTGTGWAYCNIQGSILASPQIALTVNSSLTFWYRVENLNFPQDFTVKIGNDILYQVTGATNQDYQQVGVSLAAYTGQNVSISFAGGTGVGSSFPGICLDDVSVTASNTWTGNISIAWNNPGNWSKSTVPVMSESVLIPSSPPGNRFPVIPLGTTAQCDFITIASGATLKIASGSSLEVKNP
jgi:hypothetical protein